jgi:hypothetical protein
MIQNVGQYKEFWNDAILVVAVPLGDMLYAQRIYELETKEYYNVDRDFERFDELFRRVGREDVSRFGEKASQFIIR